MVQSCDKIVSNLDQAKKSDWGCRPLSNDTKRYAAHDSHFLIAIALKQINSKKSNINYIR